jgi:hypothetical protein
MSCSAHAGLSSSGYQTIPQWTTVSTSVPGRIREIIGLRMSASMNSVRRSSPPEGRVSMPQRKLTSSSPSRCRATAVPQWLETPVISTRGPIAA